MEHVLRRMELDPPGKRKRGVKKIEYVCREDMRVVGATLEDTKDRLDGDGWSSGVNTNGRSRKRKENTNRNRHQWFPRVSSLSFGDYL